MKNLSFFFLFSFYALVTTAQAYDPLFIFEQFSNAKIHFKNRSVTVAAMNYDAVNDKMYFKNNGELMELSNQEMIDSISWAGKRSFITNGKSYLEKVNLDNGTCYIAWRIKNVNVGSAGAYGTTTQGKVESISVRSLGVFSATDAASHSGDVFQQKNANEYYLPIDGKLKKVTNLKHLYKLYPEHKDAIKEYADKEKIKMNEPLSVLQVLNYCMGLK
jgi:hypothetical protein